MQQDAFDVRDFPSLERFRGTGEQRLRVLIATEEIVGPVRNGGIASTYYHLARGLAAQGHEVTVLYLKGREVENATPEHWVGEYARFGIAFVPLPDPGEAVTGASPAWQGRWLGFYRWLRANDRFDVIHSSEWRGGAFYCLQAKRLGLAFQDSLFVVKTSSPYIWNRHYQLQLFESADLMAASFAEQKCVEWADMVVGGSAHLLSFMEHIGYRLPEGRTYVQPNIVDFAEVQVEDKRPPRAPGDVVETGELVFFGRLEPRKGLDLFVGALDALVARGANIDRVVFLGKEGQKIGGADGISPLELIARHRPNWPFEIEIVTDRDQPEALSLMCSRDMIAVMPSLIENSTMAVYEALVHQIPFVASAVGGTPELIDAADHAATLVPPQAEALADRLETVLREGQRLARPAFDNDRNLETWYGFHRYVAEQGAAALMPPATGKSPPGRLCLVRFAADSQAMAAALSLAGDGAPGFDAIRIYSPVAVSREHKALGERLESPPVSVIEMFGATIGRCFGHALAEAEADLFVFDAAGMSFAPAAAEALRQAAAARPDDLFTCAFRAAEDDAANLFLPLGGDPASQLVTGAAYGAETLAGRPGTFAAIGDFEAYPLASGILHELTGRAIADGRELYVLPDPLAEAAGDAGIAADGDGTAGFLGAKALFDAAGLAARKLLMHRGAARRSDTGARVIIGGGQGEPGEATWLTNVELIARPDRAPPKRHQLLLGFERDIGRLHFAALHGGELVIRTENSVLRRDADWGARDVVTRDHIDLLPLLAERGRLRLWIELSGRGKTRTASLVAQEIEPDLYFLSSRAAIWWGSDFETALAMIGAAAPSPPLPRLRKMPLREVSAVEKIRQAIIERR